MLADSPRNKAYRQAIFDNESTIRGKTVLDVGTGLGILAIFCAQAGAAKVYAIEASNVANLAKEIIKDNKLDDVIEVMNCKVEHVTLAEKVDVIVSEWMGFYLLHEGMLDSLIIARDKFLKPGGMIFPESATLYAAPCSVPTMFDFWDNVEGVAMSRFGEQLRVQASHKPLIISIKDTQILADPEVVLWVDLREVTLEDINSWKIEHVAVATTSGKYQGICLWFTCTFPSFTTEPVTLSTAPEDPETHWKQTIIVLPKEIEVEEKAPIAYQLALARSGESSRRYNIEVTMLDPEQAEHPEYCSCHMTKCILVRAMLDKYEQDSFGK